MRLLPFALALALTLGLSPAVADPVSPDVAAAVQGRIDSFNTMVASGDLVGTIDFTPPTLLSHMAATYGTTPKAMRGQMKDALQATQGTVTFDSFSMNLAAAQQATTPDGSRTYVMVPTEAVLSVTGGKKVISSSQTLALEEDGQWYLISITDANLVAVIKGAYPELSGVDLPAGTVKTVE